MTRDELEAVIWKRWPTRGTLANQSVDAILRAADAYASGEPRRALIPVVPVVHWQHPARAARTASCHGRVTSAHVTSNPAAVTCGTCQESRAWKAAAA